MGRSLAFLHAIRPLLIHVGKCVEVLEQAVVEYVANQAWNARAILAM